MIVDYGTGNIQSVHNALEHLGHSVTRTSNPADIQPCDVLIFPGQGAFGPAMQTLKNQHWVTPLQNYIASKRPFIGICLGFQLCFNASQESQNTQGLGVFPGTLQHFSSTMPDPTNPKGRPLSVPHMGWNTLTCQGQHPALQAVHNQHVYFVHSYYLPQTALTTFSNATSMCTTTYGAPFVSALANDTQLITQFHPEKSGKVGLSLLKGFLDTL